MPMPPFPSDQPSESIIGSLAHKQPAKSGPSSWLIISGIVVAAVGLVMRLVARSQISEAESLRMFGSVQADETIRNATTLGNVGLAFLIIGGGLAFLGVLAVVVRRT